MVDIKNNGVETNYLYSVIIPSYNRAYVLKEALDSIIAQNIHPIQIIIVDDGSTDETFDLVTQYPYPIEYVFQENKGAGQAKNVGLSRAQGKYVTFLDSDDVWMPNKLKTEQRLFERYPHIVGVISDCEAWVEEKKTHTSWFHKKGVDVHGRPRMVSDLGMFYLKESLCATGSICLKLDVLKNMPRPYFLNTLTTHEDWAFELKLYHAGEVLVYPEIMTRVRRFHDNTREDRPMPGGEVLPQY